MLVFRSVIVWNNDTRRNGHTLERNLWFMFNRCLLSPYRSKYQKWHVYAFSQHFCWEWMRCFLSLQNWQVVFLGLFKGVKLIRLDGGVHPDPTICCRDEPRFIHIQGAHAALSSFFNVVLFRPAAENFSKNSATEMDQVANIYESLRSNPTTTSLANKNLYKVITRWAKFIKVIFVQLHLRWWHSRWDQEEGGTGCVENVGFTSERPECRQDYKEFAKNVRSFWGHVTSIKYRDCIDNIWYFDIYWWYVLVVNMESNNSLYPWTYYKYT